MSNWILETTYVVIDLSTFSILYSIYTIFFYFNYVYRHKNNFIVKLIHISCSAKNL